MTSCTTKSTGAGVFLHLEEGTMNAKHLNYILRQINRITNYEYPEDCS